MTGGVFSTEDGVEVPAISAETMRAVDQAAIREQTPSLQQMMENAGRNLALTAIDHLGRDWRQAPIVVIAGSGGNGGGGICAARHLANHGGDVTLVLSAPSRLRAVTEQQLHVYEMTPGRIGGDESLDASMFLDALIGYGLDGVPGGRASELIRAMRESSVPVISLDVPSGLDSTTGEVRGESVEPVITLTLALPKTGLASPVSGEVWLGDLGIPREVFRRTGVEVPTFLFDGRYRIRLIR